MSKSQSDATRVFSLLRKLVKSKNQPAEETFELIELIGNMASQNLISQLKAAIDTTNSKLDAQRDILDTRYKGIMWTVGIAGGVISLLITLMIFLVGR